MNKKRLLGLALTLILLIAIGVNGVDLDSNKYLNEAKQLKPLGIFLGTDEGFELDREPTRLEGLIMLTRMLGKEKEAESLSSGEAYFKDIPNWARGYGNYAHDYGLALGLGDRIYGSKENIDAKAYMTFMLRSLGYDDSKGDFKYEDALEFAESKKIIKKEDLLELESKTFLRGHVAKLTMAALKSNIKDKNITLLETLKVKEEDLEIHFIDVGQGDAILIKKGDKSMLIDAGNNKDEELMVEYLKKQGIERLEYAIGTHPHADHIGGLDKVIDNFEIGKLIMPNVTHTTKTFEDVLDSMANKGLKGTIGRSGDEYSLNEANFIILAPNEDEYSNLNDYSIVIKLTDRNHSFLFTGDAEELSEKEMIEKHGSLLEADLLKVGHHGSISSTSQEFLDMVNPRYAVIQVGVDNSYKHPDDLVLERLEAKDVEVYRNDLHGDIILLSDGKDISFIKEK